MTTEIDYPGCTLNITSGANEVILSPASVVALNASNSATLAPASLTILDLSLSTQQMSVSQDGIQYGRVGGSEAIDISVAGFNALDASGNRNGVVNGHMYTTNTDGTYVNLDLATGLDINGVSGSAGQILQKDGANAMTWGAPLFCPLATEALDMNNFAISNVSAVNAPVAGTSMNGQMTFDTPPHVPDPILGNDAASKGYVDTLVGNYSGNGLALYFNYATTQTDPIIAPSVGVLGQTLAPIDSPTTDNFYRMTSNPVGTNILISTFTSAVGFPNTLTIPAGLWSMLIWGWATSQNGQLYYHFHLNEVNSAGVFVAQIGTSGFSSDVNATSAGDPDAYHCSLAIVDGYTMASVNNRLQVQIYTTGTSPTSTVLNTLFGGDYYSNIVTTLSAGASLLTQNNVWTGVNSFSAGFNTTAVDSATTLGLGSATSTATTLGRTGAPTTINAQNLTLYAGGAGTSGQVLTKGATYATWAAAPTSSFVGTADQPLNMGIYDISGTKMDSASTLALGTSTSTGTTLGRVGAPTAISANNLTLYAGGAGTSGQILTKGATYATWVDPAPSTFVGTANQPLNMGIYDISGTKMDSATTLSLGTGTATNSYIGRAGATTANVTATTINLVGAVKSTAIDSATTLSLGTGTASDTYLGRAGATTANVTATTINLVGNVKATAIDRSSAGTLNIGLLTATDVAIGRSGLSNASLTATNIALTGAVSGTTTFSASTSVTTPSIDRSGVGILEIGGAATTNLKLGRVGLADASLTANNIALTGAVSGTTTFSASTSVTTPSIDRANAGNLSIGPTNATNIVIGKAGLANASVTATAIALNGNTIVSGSMRSDSVVAPSIDVFNPGNLSIGPTTTTNVIIGRVGLADASVTATAIALNGIVTTNNAVTAGSTVSCPTLTCPSISTGQTSDTISFFNGLITGVASLFASPTRSGNLNIQNQSTNNNTVNIGSATTTTQFGGSIRGLGTTLGILTPVIPSMTYTGTGLGAISTSAVGSVVKDTPNTNKTIAASTTFTNLCNVLIPCAGVWLVTGCITIRAASAGTADRVQVNVGYGANNNLLSNIDQYTIGKLTLGDTGPTGYQLDLPFSDVYTVTTANYVVGNYISMSAANNGTTTIPLAAAMVGNNGNTQLNVVRIA